MNGNVVQSREHLIDECCNTRPVTSDRTNSVNGKLDSLYSQLTALRGMVIALNERGCSDS
jgi:hypothetical protein